jgi:hypothetical protein
MALFKSTKTFGSKPPFQLSILDLHSQPAGVVFTAGVILKILSSEAIEFLRLRSWYT